MKHQNLETFANGALSSQINQALQQVTSNIQDPNTDATKARKITATITLKPDDLRDFVTASIVTKVTLPPTLGAVTAFSMGKDLETGEVDCTEVGKQIPGQLSMQEIGTKIESIQGYDPSTGEIYDATPHETKVINLREQAK